MDNGVSWSGLPLYKLIILSKPFRVNICEELNLMGVSVVGSNLHAKVREGDGLID